MLWSSASNCICFSDYIALQLISPLFFYSHSIFSVFNEILLLDFERFFMRNITLGKMRKGNSYAFTLVELLVVIAISVF